MRYESSRTPSRRQFLGVTAGTIATVSTAGCLDSVIGSSAAATEIEPEEPSQPRKGSPGEFYYFLESNGVAVDELLLDDDELYLTYRSEAETVEESDEEIRIVYEVYKQALIHRGSSVEFLYAEIANPFDGQALGWGIDSKWIHRFDPADENGEDDSENSMEDDAGNESTDNETTSNESEDNGIDMNEVTLWSNIMNTKVYEEDLEEDQSGIENATESDE